MEIILAPIYLIVHIWSIVTIIRSNASTGGKVGWIVVLIVMPVVGFLLWLFFGPKDRAGATV
jgi:hypothetical protein